MKLLVDMNLSPAWVKILQQAGFDAIHWSEVGSPDAPDKTLFVWAREHKYIVFTHDMDFGAMLAATFVPRGLTIKPFSHTTRLMTCNLLAKII